MTTEVYTTDKEITGKFGESMETLHNMAVFVFRDGGKLDPGSETLKDDSWDCLVELKDRFSLSFRDLVIAIFGGPHRGRRSVLGTLECTNSCCIGEKEV